MKLTTHYVLRLNWRPNWYIGPTGALVNGRHNAGRFTRTDAMMLLYPSRRSGHPLFTLSLEEVPKRERRRYSPQESSREAVEYWRRSDLTAKRDQYRRDAEDAESRASFYRKEMRKIDEILKDFA